MSKSNIVAEPNSQSITMTRSFDAPRDLVFKMFVESEHLAQWWSGAPTTIDKLDARSGGQWRIVLDDPDGSQFAFNGVFHAVDAPERIVQTFEFEGMPGHVLLETITFDEQDGKTHLTQLSVYQSVADRDGMLQSGMEGGANESYDRLDALLAQAQGK